MDMYVISRERFASRNYGIIRNGESCGTVAFRGFCGTRARARMHDREWTLARRGFLHHVVEIGSGGDVARAPVHFSGNCELTLDGAKYRWICERILGGAFVWVDADRTVAIRSTHSASGRGAREFVVLSSTLPPQNVDTLVVLGAYLHIVRASDAAAAAAALIASSAA